MRGSVSLMAAVAIGLILVLGVLAVDVVGLMAGRAQAEAAADAAALAAAPATFTPAGLGSPRRAAEVTAAANGARLTRCRCEPVAGLRPRTVTVRVVVDWPSRLLGSVAIVAEAAARFDPLAAMGR